MTIPLLVVGKALSLAAVPGAHDVVVPVAAPERKQQYSLQNNKIFLHDQLCESGVATQRFVDCLCHHYQWMVG